MKALNAEALKLAREHYLDHCDNPSECQNTGCVIARALIERLEPVKIKRRGWLTGPECPNCQDRYAPLSNGVFKFCPNCGRPIQWT